MRNGSQAKLEPRQRLIDGMIQAAGRHGYGGATVSRVVEQAGVSRATFYEHFADKEACFLAAFEQAVQPIEQALERIEGYEPPRRAPALLDDLLAGVVRDPDAARVLLVEALASGGPVREARRRLAQDIEARLERWFSAPGYGGRLAVSGRVILEGMAGVLVIRAFRGETARLAEIRDDLLAWIDSYSAPEEEPRLDLADWRRLGAGLAESPPEPQPRLARRLPRGKSAIAPEVVAAEQRERILEAVAALAREKGYAAMTVADIVKNGAVTRQAFYAQFRSKEDAFLAAQTVGLEASVSQVAGKFFGAGDWPSRVWDGLEALLLYVAGKPDLVHVEIIESYAAGPAAIRRSFDHRMAYTLFLEDGYRQGPSAEARPRLCSEAIAAAILGLMHWQIGEGRAERMLELLPQAAFVALAPFLGVAAAVELVEAKAAAGAGSG